MKSCPVDMAELLILDRRQIPIQVVKDGDTCSWAIKRIKQCISSWLCLGTNNEISALNYRIRYGTTYVPEILIRCQCGMKKDDSYIQWRISCNGRSIRYYQQVDKGGLSESIWYTSGATL
jgi:hypothetical protein